MRSILGLLAAASVAAGIPVPRVVVVETPGRGIQPQAVVDRAGTLHLVYFTGDPARGDLYYVRRTPGQSAFSSPIRVNSEPASVLATGSIRGGQLAVGRDGWIHVAWHSTPPVKDGAMQPAPMWYARLRAGAPAFEPEQTIGQRLK